MKIFAIFWLGIAIASALPPLPVGPPLDAPAYMVDNRGNTFGVAPDKGSLDKLESKPKNLVPKSGIEGSFDKLKDRENGGYWLGGVKHGLMPLVAESNYTFFRNVKEYGAKGDGTTDDTAAINRAVAAGARCGKGCGSSTTSGALVYFPAGIYIVSSPIIQYYYTQFVGDPNSKPVIKGAATFKGIALIDTDPYIPLGNGAQWYQSTNQFFRQIRNFVIDLTAMPKSNSDGGQTYVPTGIHWQVAQATSLQNIDFVMPVSDAAGATTAVGIFMESGSGGFVSDLTFFGGNIGFRAGTQQFTARNLKFTSCLTAISMIWDWGFTWKSISVLSCYIALDCTQFGGGNNQGTGSISVLDSHFNGVPYAITTNANGPKPNIVLDNLLVENSASIVLISGGKTILPGSVEATTIRSWAMGERFASTNGSGSNVTGPLIPSTVKSTPLLDATGKYFERSKPQYETETVASIVVATSHGVCNEGKTDQTNAINELLSVNKGAVVFFPAGIYLVQGTVFVPVGSRIVGEGWSQIMGYGPYFADEKNPKAVVKVGNPGDSGILEISDMLFTVKGPTAGAILMEWNVHQSSQGSVGMWDSHFRVGGALGSDLQSDKCPQSSSVNPSCKAASMLLHVTPTASGYFENIWAWTADHDLDVPAGGPTNVQLNVYAARGILIESGGPVWMYGTASEHNVLYQYQLFNAKDVFLGHLQTETPYFQPNPDATKPFTIGVFPSDPTFKDCGSVTSCAEAWALRIIGSTNIYVYSAGLYSFFSDYAPDCASSDTCQEKLFDIISSSGLWIYNVFTVGAVEAISPARYKRWFCFVTRADINSGLPPVIVKDIGKIGFTSEISAWLPLAIRGVQDRSNNGSNITTSYGQGSSSTRSTKLIKSTRRGRSSRRVKAYGRA